MDHGERRNLLQLGAPDARVVRVRFGTGLERQGTVQVRARTLGEAIEALTDEEPWLDPSEVRWFVDGVDAADLEGEHTPVGDEDTILVTAWTS